MFTESIFVCARIESTMIKTWRYAVRMQSARVRVLRDADTLDKENERTTRAVTHQKCITETEVDEHYKNSGIQAKKRI